MLKIALLVLTLILIIALNVQLDLIYLVVHACLAIPFASPVLVQLRAALSAHQVSSTMLLSSTAVLVLPTVSSAIQMEPVLAVGEGLCWPIHRVEAV